MQFVIQEFKSSNGGPKYYLRLERDGVLKGWTVPKGLPEMGEKPHLAMEVGPFKLAAAGFEGKVEKSKYGPGMISVWDSGKYRIHSWAEDEIIFELSGSRVKGSFALIRFPKAGPLHWLLNRPRSSPPASLSVNQPETVIKTPEKSHVVQPDKNAAVRNTIGEESPASKSSSPSIPAIKDRPPRRSSQPKITSNPRKREKPGPKPVQRKKPRAASVQRKKRPPTYHKPSIIKQLFERKGKRRFIKRKQFTYDTGYTAHDWWMLAAFVMIGLIVLVVLTIMINVR